MTDTSKEASSTSSSASPWTEDENEIRSALEIWERVGAAALGLVLAVGGTYAVFKSANQAGTAVMLVGAIAFLLIGVQGTALVRLGSGNNSIELERRRRVKEALRKAATEENADVARGIIEAAAIIEPAFAPVEEMVWQRYERAVAAAIQRVTADGLEEIVTGPGTAVDFVGKTKSGARFQVAVKYRRRGKLAASDVAALIGYSTDRIPGLLIVTNAELTDTARELNSRVAGEERHPFEIVQWNGLLDDDALARAIGRTARIQGPQTA